MTDEKRPDPTDVRWQEAADALAVPVEGDRERLDYSSALAIPCPFDGGTAYVTKEERDGYADYPDDPDRFAYAVRCVTCAAQGPWVKSSGMGAITQWNRRAGVSLTGSGLREAAQEWADLCNDHDLNERGQAVMARLRAALSGESGEPTGSDPVERDYSFLDEWVGESGEPKETER